MLHIFMLPSFYTAFFLGHLENPKFSPSAPPKTKGCDRRQSRPPRL